MSNTTTPLFMRLWSNKFFKFLMLSGALISLLTPPLGSNAPADAQQQPVNAQARR